jgi:hypothetical protein
MLGKPGAELTSVFLAWGALSFINIWQKSRTTRALASQMQTGHVNKIT